MSHRILGGTLFEKCYYQNKIMELTRFLKDNNVDWIEISCGTLDIPLKVRLNLIQDLKHEFNILSEVGSKNVLKKMSTDEWINEISLLLDAGSRYCITEGRVIQRKK